MRCSAVDRRGNSFTVFGVDSWHPNVRAMYDAAESAGVRIRASRLSDLWRCVVSGTDVVHVHWLERMLASRRRLFCIARMAGFFAVLGAARLRGVRVVWTVHNVLSHDATHPLLELLSQRAMVRLASTVHFTSVTAARRATDRLGPVLARRHSLVVPLPTLDPVQPPLL